MDVHVRSGHHVAVLNETNGRYWLARNVDGALVVRSTFDFPQTMIEGILRIANEGA
jgi:hypothetical protein